jgi:hypothetical protein
MKLRDLVGQLPKSANPEIAEIVASLAGIFRKVRELSVDMNIWTPTITTGTGTITASSASGTYHTIGPLTFFRVQISITTNGTGDASVKFTLPTAATQTYVFSGRESTVGRQLQGIVSTSSNVVTVLNYDNTYPGANGNVLHIAGFYH